MTGVKDLVKTIKQVKKIGVVIEEHFDASEFRQFNEYFPQHGYEVEYLSHLWGNPQLTFGSNPENNQIEFHVTVTKEIQTADPNSYKGIIFIGAYAMDRLRYEEYPVKNQPNQAPTVNFLRKAIQHPTLKFGTICHSLCIFCADPSLLKGKKVTCAHNIICDVENAGGDVQFEGNQTADVIIDGNLISAKHPGVLDKFLEVFRNEIERTNVKEKL